MDKNKFLELRDVVEKYAEIDSDVNYLVRKIDSLNELREWTNKSDCKLGDIEIYPDDKTICNFNIMVTKDIIICVIDCLEQQLKNKIEECKKKLEEI